MYKSTITIPFKSDWDNDGVWERLKKFDWYDEMLIPLAINFISYVTSKKDLIIKLHRTYNK